MVGARGGPRVAARGSGRRSGCLRPQGPRSGAPRRAPRAATIVNDAPPVPSDRAAPATRSPPIARHSSRDTYRPRPLPSSAGRSPPRSNRPNSRPRSASGTPGPPSVIVSASREPAAVDGAISTVDRRAGRRTSARCRGAPTGPGRAGRRRRPRASRPSSSSSVERTSSRAERLPGPADARARARRRRSAGAGRPTPAGSPSGAGGPSATAGRTAR